MRMPGRSELLCCPTHHFEYGLGVLLSLSAHEQIAITDRLTDLRHANELTLHTQKHEMSLRALSDSGKLLAALIIHFKEQKGVTVFCRYGCDLLHICLDEYGLWQRI